MKNLLLIVAFVLISATGFSQTFTLSSSTPGQTIVETYTINSGGYGYIYNLSASRSAVWVIAPPLGTLAVLDNPNGSLQESYGSGEFRNPYSSSSCQLVVVVSNQTTVYSVWGYARVYVFPH